MIGGNTLWDIALEKFLKLDWKLADSLCPHIVIPLNDFAVLVRLGVFGDPLSDRFVIGTGGHKFPEGLGCQSGKVEKEIIQWAVKLVFPKRACNRRATFVESSGGNDVASKSFMRAAGIVTCLGKIRGGHVDDSCRLSSGVKPPLFR